MQLMPEDQRLQLVSQNLDAFTEFDPIIGEQLKEQIAERRALEEAKRKLLKSRRRAFVALRVVEKAAKKQARIALRQRQADITRAATEARKAKAQRKRNFITARKGLRAELSSQRKSMRALGAKQRRIYRQLGYAKLRHQQPKPKSYRRSSAIAEARRELRAELKPLKAAMRRLRIKQQQGQGCSGRRQPLGIA
ncbi:hypothetical protein MITS9509_03207 [Synechococcus sp. MIT S9509]|nr:hypothetical protein MITS9504_03113 [Synechococcus sp. MIT S9504]KZR88881.1 hypothetical protein MITS9509_03207 [Synechococcus sp. MIT S9509]